MQDVAAAGAYVDGRLALVVFDFAAAPRVEKLSSALREIAPPSTTVIPIDPAKDCSGRPTPLSLEQLASEYATLLAPYATGGWRLVIVGFCTATVVAKRVHHLLGPGSSSLLVDVEPSEPTIDTFCDEISRIVGTMGCERSLVSQDAEVSTIFQDGMALLREALSLFCTKLEIPSDDPLLSEMYGNYQGWLLYLWICRQSTGLGNAQESKGADLTIESTADIQMAVRRIMHYVETSQ